MDASCVRLMGDTSLAGNTLSPNQGAPYMNAIDGRISPRLDARLSDRVALFDTQANKHLQNQSVNPFSNGQAVGVMEKPKFSKEEYGRPAPGSLSEKRGQKATQHICKAMLELCEIIHEYGADYNEEGTQRIIFFGELFNIYTVISDKLVGMLLRARKHKLLDFEGECLFQRRDDNVPVILLKPINEIRQIFKNKDEPAATTS